MVGLILMMQVRPRKPIRTPAETLQERTEQKFNYPVKAINPPRLGTSVRCMHAKQPHNLLRKHLWPFGFLELAHV